MHQPSAVEIGVRLLSKDPGLGFDACQARPVLPGDQTSLPLSSATKTVRGPERESGSDDHPSGLSVRGLRRPPLEGERVHDAHTETAGG